MTDNSCEEQITQIIIKTGRLIRELKGLPQEKNITVIYNETALLLGVNPRIHHISQDNPFVNFCPVCRKETYYLTSICRSCKESEEGKYKTVLECFECHHKEKSEDPIVVWLDRWKVDYKTQTKASLGIKTLTDEGVQ